MRCYLIPTFLFILNGTHKICILYIFMPKLDVTIGARKTSFRYKRRHLIFIKSTLSFFTPI